MSSRQAITQGDGKPWFERIESLLERVRAMAASALSKVPDVVFKFQAKGIAPAANVIVGSVDLSKFPLTALAWQVQFVTEEGSLQQADSARFTTTAQGGIVPFVAATTTTPLVAQAGDFAAPNVAPTYTVVLNGTILEAHVVNNNPVNPINCRVAFYADIESF